MSLGRLGLDDTSLDSLAKMFRDASTMTGHLTAEAVKGIGYAFGGRAPVDDPAVIAPAITKAQLALRKATLDGINRPSEVVKGLAPEFQAAVNTYMSASPMNWQLTQWVEQIKNQISQVLGKDITLTTPLATGFVPFDLLAPARLIYPVFSPLRNKLPRVPGQGTSRRAKILTGIPGSRTGGSVGNPIDWAIGEFPAGQNLANWPMQLPPSDSYSGATQDLSIPYRFHGRSEQISWLAQFSGQGFQDIAGLANLILIQKASLAEEYELLYGVNSALANPGKATLTSRSPVSGEVGLTVTTNNHIYVLVTALDGFGRETAFASGNVQDSGVFTSGNVLDVQISPVPGAVAYNIYAVQGTAAPSAASGIFLVGSNIGGTLWTYQNATVPTSSGTNPPTSNGTGNSNAYDGIVSILSGKAAGGTYPSGIQGGYLNQSAASQARVSLFNTVLENLWAVTKADPTEIFFEGSDIGRLSDDIRANASNQAYRMFIAQSDFASMVAGAAVAEFANPVTRKLVQLTVHPWLTQGTALVMSYTIPFPFSEVGNIWEVVNVQDYLSIAWPVIDASYRFSLFLYGTLATYAPIYCGIVQGMQVSDSKPYK